MDNYTHAGIHKNQIVNNGYGIITSDEGHRFNKQHKNCQLSTCQPSTIHKQY